MTYVFGGTLNPTLLLKGFLCSSIILIHALIIIITIIITTTTDKKCKNNTYRVNLYGIISSTTI